MNPLPVPSNTKTSRPLAQNRRRGNRHRLHVQAVLVAEGENVSPVQVTVTELSIGGVGLRSKTSLPLDGIYHLNSFDTLIAPGTRIRIVSQQPGQHGEFQIGAQTL